MLDQIKTLLLATALMVCVSGYLYSQESSLKYGVRAVFNLGNINGGDPNPLVINNDEINVDTDYKFRSGFSGGGFLEYWFSSRFAIQLNALYNQKGSRIDSVFDGSYFDPQVGYLLNIFLENKHTIKISYFSFPVLLKFSFTGNRSSAFNPFIVAGPEIAVLNSAKTSQLKGRGFGYVAGGGGSGIDYEIAGKDVKDELEPVEFSLNVGTGFDFRMGNLGAFLDIRYGLGLTGIKKDGDQEIKNRVVYLNLGFMF